MKKFNIAIDGPSGVGKSSAADGLAEIYNLTHIDTGAMYRAIALALHQSNIPPVCNDSLQDALNAINLEYKEGNVILDGEDVSSSIRTPEVSLLASQYSALPPVRQKLVALQQNIAQSKGYILDGRDICDVVLPDAEIKIYLDASAAARAKRRYLQDLQKGKEVIFEKVLEDIEVRDEQDRNREISPLKVSDQAVYVDSSNMNLEETIAALQEIVENELRKGA